MTTKKQIQKSRYTGYLHGSHFDGEWPNGEEMSGYGIYFCENGKSTHTEISPKQVHCATEKMQETASNR